MSSNSNQRYFIGQVNGSRIRGWWMMHHVVSLRSVALGPMNVHNRLHDTYRMSYCCCYTILRECECRFRYSQWQCC